MNPETKDVFKVEATTTRRMGSAVAGSIDAENRTVTVSFSSESEVLRNVWDLGIPFETAARLADALESENFYEVLGHEEGEYDFERLMTSGPVLLDHDRQKHIGTVRNVHVKDKRGMAEMVLSRRQEAQDVLNDMADGILKDTSVGSTIREFRIVGERDGIPVLRATKWTAREVSLVSMGADLAVGVNRSEADAQRAKYHSNKNSNTKEVNMSDNADNKPDPKIDIQAETKRAIEKERKRAAEVLDAIDFCRDERGLEIPDDTRKQADDNSWGYNEVCAHVLSKQPASNRGADTKVLDEMQRKEKRGFSVLRAISGAMSKNGVQGFEAEVMKEIESVTGQRSAEGGLLIPLSALSTQRSMLAGVFDQGGSTVPVETGPMIEKLDPVPVVEQAGAMMLRGLNSPVSFPRHTTAAVAQWVGEAQEVEKSTPGTDDVMLTPHGLAAYVEISRQLALTSSIDVEAFVRGEILRRINLGIDKAALVGSGTNGVPKGLFALAASAINEVTFGDPPTWKKILEFEGAIEDQDGLDGTLAWITSAPVKQAWKGTSKDTGSGLFLATQDNTANGYPVLVTSQLAGTIGANKVVFGNFMQLMVGMYGAIEILVDQSASLQRRGLIGLTGLAHADVAVRQGKAFARSTDTGNQ